MVRSLVSVVISTEDPNSRSGAHNLRSGTFNRLLRPMMVMAPFSNLWNGLGLGFRNS